MDAVHYINTQISWLEKEREFNASETANQYSSEKEKALLVELNALRWVLSMLVDSKD